MAKTPAKPKTPAKAPAAASPPPLTETLLPLVEAAVAAYGQVAALRAAPVDPEAPGHELADAQLADAQIEVERAMAAIETAVRADTAVRLAAADAEAERQLAAKREALAAQLAAMDSARVTAGPELRTEVAPDVPAEPVEGHVRLVVIGPPAGRRRGGHQFGAEPVTIDVDHAAAELIRQDATLSVTAIPAP
jgi:hypothetical protein